MDNLEEAPLNAQQRLKRARLMKRLAPKLARARKIRKNRRADAPRLQKRAEKKARNVVRTKVAGSKGADYKDLSIGGKISIDKLVQNKTPMIKKIAKRLLPGVRKAERDRFSARNEELNEKHYKVSVSYKKDPKSTPTINHVSANSDAEALKKVKASQKKTFPDMPDSVWSYEIVEASSPFQKIRNLDKARQAVGKKSFTASKKVKEYRKYKVGISTFRVPVYDDGSTGPIPAGATLVKEDSALMQRQERERNSLRDKQARERARSKIRKLRTKTQNTVRSN